ncbi:hypothetical protein NECAME_06116 [Necator americanus]|uniref:Uncharacterized protein n=1 Tax=Necator americanus TaxID=51031 RepID=W2TYB4_NECAM|nr:hypothetical protein NECAME_06116 [Necator americanus]ETN86041.1 hypothetical protein NECAME_06116 [Necator americanus]
MLICVLQFTIPGTRRNFCPQVYVSVCVFIPFLAFEQDLNKFDSTCGDVECVGEYETARTLSVCTDGSPSKDSGYVVSRFTPSRARNINIMDYVKGVWCVRRNEQLPTKRALLTTVSSAAEDESNTRNPLCDGYIHPEWALIFMLRLGLIAVQMMPENTQSSKHYCDHGCRVWYARRTCTATAFESAKKLHCVLFFYTSEGCTFLTLQGRSRSEACFGHVPSCELFHFLAMATFGVYIPNCRCSIGVDMNNIHEPLVCSDAEEEVDLEEFKPLNPFHRALLCWCFQNALQDNVHITNLVNEINAEFALLYKK